MDNIDNAVKDYNKALNMISKVNNLTNKSKLTNEVKAFVDAGNNFDVCTSEINSISNADYQFCKANAGYCFCYAAVLSSKLSQAKNYAGGAIDLLNEAKDGNGWSKFDVKKCDFLISQMQKILDYQNHTNDVAPQWGTNSHFYLDIDQGKGSKLIVGAIILAIGLWFVKSKVMK